MPVLFLSILLYIGAVLLVVWGALPLVPGIIWLAIGFIPFTGLKVIKPQAALMLTLFGRYIGTLRDEGFWFVHPFSTSVNPAAKTRLGQSADVDSDAKLSTASGSNTAQVEMPDKKISLKVMTLNNSKQKVNDCLGNPIEIGIAVMWRVMDTAKAAFMMDNLRSTFRCSATARCATLCASIPMMLPLAWIQRAMVNRMKAACAAQAVWCLSGSTLIWFYQYRRRTDIIGIETSDQVKKFEPKKQALYLFCFCLKWGMSGCSGLASPVRVGYNLQENAI